MQIQHFEYFVAKGASRPIMFQHMSLQRGLIRKILGTV
jgi:hypothetical protein